MLFLMFRIGRDRYVLDVEQIEQVLPLMQAKALPGAPPGVAGVINYRGEPVPLIDLVALATGRPAASVMSTRIILVRYPAPGEGAHRLGLCAERVIDTIQRDPGDFAATGVEAGTPAWLGPVAADADGFVQWVRAPALLTDDIRAVLFRPAGAEA
ncbi:chemotaxis-related protein WspB [Ancylobacter sp. 3268]|uniref:chemotaxis protein CheW n=1 Tax=Ancylobacter sp. 3268 TaxID=2817752 RepID=UPI002858714B|nr:chemotaxis protein CheW [Ancylobacter sp. 3268]MDR6953939.1 chemotaxis-related protein WspB [Ancylobacter sp. 3268]